MSTQLWFLSDPHFSHQNILNFTIDAEGTKLRPGFKDIDHMNEVIINNWNKVIRPQDHGYIMGDVAMKRAFLPIVKRLNGHKRLIFGNHDIFDWKEYIEAGFEKLMGMRVLDGMIFTHVPVHPSQLNRFKANIHGHTHQHFVKLDSGHPDKRYLNLCCEKVNYTPVALEDIKKQLNDRT